MKRPRRPTEDEILRLAPGMGSDVFEVIGASIEDHVLVLQFRITKSRFRTRKKSQIFGAKLPLVDSHLPMPFLYFHPEDEEDFLGMARIWMNEQIETMCAEWAATHLDDGVLYFEVAPYGFLTTDLKRHAELTESASGSWDNSAVAEEMRRPRS